MLPPVVQPLVILCMCLRPQSPSAHCGFVWVLVFCVSLVTSWLLIASCLFLAYSSQVLVSQFLIFGWSFVFQEIKLPLLVDLFVSEPCVWLLPLPAIQPNLDRNNSGFSGHVAH